MNKLAIVLLVVGLFCSQLKAQTTYGKFGKISDEEMDMEVYPLDSSASAVILFKSGVTRFEMNPHNQHFVKILHYSHVRIKILSQEGLKYADVIIPAYEDGSYKQSVSGFKAVVYNEENGKVEKEKVGMRDVIVEEISKEKSLYKTSLPKVKVGSVIEFKYNFHSDFWYNLIPWEFQYKIPVAKSSYYVEIPNYFNFNENVLGHHTVKRSTTNGSGQIQFANKERRGAYNTKTEIHYSTVNYIKNIIEYTAENVPALKEEPYVTTMYNYTTKVEYELRSY